MGIETQIQLFDNAKIRVAWDDEKEKYFFSVVDVLHVLTDSANPQTYWRVLKKRLLDEGNETVTNCNALKLPSADGKMRLTDVADLEGILFIWTFVMIGLALWGHILVDWSHILMVVAWMLIVLKQSKRFFNCKHK